MITKGLRSTTSLPAWPAARGRALACMRGGHSGAGGRMVEGSHVVCGRAAVGCGMQGVRAPVLLCLRALPGSQGHEGN
ncbi:MAG TPA: hypothetical protein PKX20_02260 [Methanothrix soehngenii]|nr:hypothetical protein [Methanothrix soehngenii]